MDAVQAECSANTNVITLARISCLWKPNAPVIRMHAVVMLDSINRCYIGTKRAFNGVI